MKNLSKVLILEDDVLLAQRISTLLVHKNYDVHHTSNSDTFFTELREFRPDVILIDVYLVGSRLNGIQVLKYINTNMDLNYKIIVISGEVTAAQVQEIRQLGAYHFIEKGASFNINQLLLNIENAIQLKKQEEENIGLQIEYLNLKKQFTRSFPFIGHSDAIEKVRNQIIRLAAADEDLFLVGETGTGKEIAANYYYINSKRFGRPFHTVNCSALNESLIESELFGHVKGAFTSADRNKSGFFEECKDGILFLDEVTNLSMAAQSKILRAIENKEIQVVGGNLKKVDTRLIFATNSTLDDLIEKNILRKDLFYRIEGNVVELPPLRDRGDDILLLISYFLSSFSSSYTFSDQTDINELREMLLSYEWPGNIRELRNFCKFIMINEKEIDNKCIISHLKQ
ncbi:MAG: sigma-54 dependent transcriptional regulator, partial [Candidatus Cloacimonadaceae bacterium]|nr:sigma-54 dependent transcriptional regulator [Candidatus Cloacimonadaceae bacterium]